MPPNSQRCNTKHNRGLRDNNTCPLCPLSLLLPSICRPGLCFLFPITPYHNDAQKAPYDCRSEKDENDWYANGPDAGREEVVEGVALIDKGLLEKEMAVLAEAQREGETGKVCEVGVVMCVLERSCGDIP